MQAETDGQILADLAFREIEEHVSNHEIIKLGNSGEYRGFYPHSAGNIVAHLKNESDRVSVVKIGFITTYYPITVDAETTTSDEQLNTVLKVCKHTFTMRKKECISKD